MSYADDAAALERAAAPALAAIAEDAERAPRWLRPLFAAIAETLFEPDLDLKTVREAAGFADDEVFSDLREVVGQPAWSLLRDARLETAARLLLETEISIAEIGRLVGYSSVSYFRGLIRDFLGMQASELRRRAAARSERAGPLPAGADTNAYWRRVRSGELTDDEARALDDALERLAPASAPPPPAVGEDRRIKLHRTVAAGLAGTLEQLPFADQRRLVRDAVWFPDGSLFEELSRRSREAGDAGELADEPEDLAGEPEGRPGGDPEGRRGVELALLAVDSLEGNGMSETHPNHAALAWARLGLARWRSGDPTGAEQDLERSTRVFEEGRQPGYAPPAVLEAERSRVVAAFHWLRGRYRHALMLAEWSAAAHRKAGSETLWKALVLRAELRTAVADLERGDAAGLRDALADVEEAYSLPGAERTDEAEELRRRLEAAVGEADAGGTAGAGKVENVLTRREWERRARRGALRLAV